MVIQGKERISVTAYWTSALVAFLTGVILTAFVSNDVCTHSEFTKDTQAAIAQREAVLDAATVAARERDSLRALLR